VFVERIIAANSVEDSRVVHSNMLYGEGTAAALHAADARGEARTGSGSAGAHGGKKLQQLRRLQNQLLSLQFLPTDGADANVVPDEARLPAAAQVRLFADRDRVVRLQLPVGLSEVDVDNVRPPPAPVRAAGLPALGAAPPGVPTSPAVSPGKRRGSQEAGSAAEAAAPTGGRAGDPKRVRFM